MSSFVLYMIGVIIVVAALSYAAHLLGLSSTWITILALTIISFNKLGNYKNRDSSALPIPSAILDR